MNRRDFLKKTGIGAAAALLPLSLLSSGPGAEPPNIIFILVDDMGYGDAAVYGSGTNHTPNINRLAADGMRFTDAYAAAPNCSPTRASILTGKWPARLGITQYLPGNQRATRRKKMLQPDLSPGLLPREITIAEALKDAGYRSASIGKWHLGGKEYLPERQGFDVNFGGGPQGHHRTMFSPYKGLNIPDTPPGEYLTDRLTEEAVNFIAETRDRPFLLYLSHYAVHHPVQGKEALVQKYREKMPEGSAMNPQFAAMLESVDRSLGEIRAKLAQRRLLENTVIFFFSDNGGVLKQGADNGAFRAGKGWLYEGGIREPLIVSWPGRIPAGSECRTPVSSIDFFPTILHLAGSGPAPSDGSVDGVDLTPLLLENRPLKREALYWHYPHYSNAGSPPCGAIRRGKYKLLEFFEDGHLELYDLEKDAGETENLAARMPEKTAELHRLLVEWRSRTGAEMPVPNPDYGKE